MCPFVFDIRRYWEEAKAPCERHDGREPYSLACTNSSVNPDSAPGAGCRDLNQAAPDR